MAKTAEKPGRIGVKELKNRVSEIVHEVREAQATYVVTLRGEPVAELRPLIQAATEERRQEQLAQVRRDIVDLAHRVGRSWTAPEGAVDLVDLQRR